MFEAKSWLDILVLPMVAMAQVPLWLRGRWVVRRALDTSDRRSFALRLTWVGNLGGKKE